MDGPLFVFLRGPRDVMMTMKTGTMCPDGQMTNEGMPQIAQAFNRFRHQWKTLQWSANTLASAKAF